MVHSRRMGAAIGVLGLVLISAVVVVSSFQTLPVFSSHSTHHQVMRTFHPQRTHKQQQPPCTRDGSSTSLHSFMGSDGGLFGIGTPELLTILLVGYFILGPSDLYKLVKEIGKFIQNARTLGTEATKTFENTMESQLELKEIRKAQRELNDAFSFRRSINVDDTADPFATKPGEPTEEIPEAAAAATTAAVATATADDAAEPTPKKKKRRRIKKKSADIPDLDMTGDFAAAEQPTSSTMSVAPKADVDDDADDWFADSDNKRKLPSVSEMVAEEEAWLTDPAVEQSRFQQQLSGAWNQKVLDNQDELAPLAMIMERLAILEEERAAAEKRLDDEFRERFQLEEDFYRKKRALLEEAASKVQEDAYVTMDAATTKSDRS